MSWPLPCISINSDSGKSWLEEFLGPEPKFNQIGDNIKANSSAIICGDKLFLTYGNSSMLTTGNPEYISKPYERHQGAEACGTKRENT